MSFYTHPLNNLVLNSDGDAKLRKYLLDNIQDLQYEQIAGLPIERVMHALIKASGKTETSLASTVTIGNPFARSLRPRIIYDLKRLSAFEFDSSLGSRQRGYVNKAGVSAGRQDDQIISEYVANTIDIIIQEVNKKDIDKVDFNAIPKPKRKDHIIPVSEGKQLILEIVDPEEKKFNRDEVTFSEILQAAGITKAEFEKMLYKPALYQGELIGRNIEISKGIKNLFLGGDHLMDDRIARKIGNIVKNVMYPPISPDGIKATNLQSPQMLYTANNQALKEAFCLGLELDPSQYKENFLELFNKAIEKGGYAIYSEEGKQSSIKDNRGNTLSRKMADKLRELVTKNEIQPDEKDEIMPSKAAFGSALSSLTIGSNYPDRKHFMTPKRAWLMGCVLKDEGVHLETTTAQDLSNNTNMLR